MARFWTSWISGNYEDEGCTKPPFKFWETGSIGRPNYGLSAEDYEKFLALGDDEDEADAFLDDHSRDDCTICAMIDADSEEKVWELVAKHFPDYRQRFIEHVAPDAVPSDRFR